MLPRVETPMRRTVLLLALLASGMAAAEGPAKQPRPLRTADEVTRMAVLAHADTDADGVLSADETDRLLAGLGASIAARVGKRHPERAAELQGPEGRQKLLRLVGNHLAGKAWLKAIGDQVERREHSPEDLIEIRTTATIPIEGGRHRAFVRIEWGDLDDRIAGGGRQYYSDWAGSFRSPESTATVVRKIAFDDAKGKEPKTGGGADRLDEAGTAGEVRWRAATVGWTDGLLIQVDLPGPSGHGRVEAGGFTIDLHFRPAPEGVVLPDGSVTTGTATLR
jgi:hypothetical protein